MMSILKKLTLASAAAGMMLLGPISIGDNSAQADRDGWRGSRGWNRGGSWNRGGWVRRGIPGDGRRGGRSWSGYRGYRPYYYGGYYRPYYRPYYSPYRGFRPWYGYGIGVQVW